MIDFLRESISPKRFTFAFIDDDEKKNIEKKIPEELDFSEEINKLGEVQKSIENKIKVILTKVVIS